MKIFKVNFWLEIPQLPELPVNLQHCDMDKAKSICIVVRETGVRRRIRYMPKGSCIIYV
jgi:hypothetical protein